MYFQQGHLSSTIYYINSQEQQQESRREQQTNLCTLMPQPLGREASDNHFSSLFFCFSSTGKDMSW